MNQQQRQFLIKKIEAQTHTRNEELRKSRPDLPLISKYINRDLLNGTLKLRSEAEIIEELKTIVLNDKSFIESGGYRYGENGENVKIKAHVMFVIPEDYKEAYNAAVTERGRIDQEMAQLSAETNALVTRLQLASDKTLQAMINEVDDMGDIKLMETVLRQQAIGPVSVKLLK